MAAARGSTDKLSEVQQWRVDESSAHPMHQKHGRKGMRALEGMRAPPSKEAKARFRLRVQLK